MKHLARDGYLPADGSGKEADFVLTLMLVVLQTS